MKINSVKHLFSSLSKDILSLSEFQLANQLAAKKQYLQAD